MARRPAHILAAAAKPQGRQVIWEAIRARRDGFRLAELASDTDIHPDTIRSYLRGLEAAGYIEALLGSPYAPSTPTFAWRLVKDTGIEAPRVTRDGKPVTQGAAREQMWRTMRILSGDWSWRDLAIAATTAEVAVAETDAKDYCANLAKAGYLVVMTKGKPSGKASVPTRYRFNRAKYKGPKPPMVQRLNSVFDPNLGKIVWQEAPRHD